MRRSTLRRQLALRSLSCSSHHHDRMKIIPPTFCWQRHPERMEIIQPRVARYELPWDTEPNARYPERVVSALRNSLDGRGKTRASTVLLVALLLSGCATNTASRPASGTAGKSASTGEVAGKQDHTTAHAILLVGKVVRVNPSARFVVLNFPVGRLPSMDQRLILYRSGLKVGEVKVSSWQYDDSVVADILAGDSQVGDEARDR